MKSSPEKDLPRSALKSLKLILGIIAVSVLTLQPMVPASALGPGPDPGPDLGPGR